MNGDDPTGCEGMYYSCILYYIKRRREWRDDDVIHGRTTTQLTLKDKQVLLFDMQK